jgi:Arc/MetJ-type ribon-helix-helix transcriptional regulator
MVRLPRRKFSSDTVPVSTRITKSALQEIEQIIKDGYYTDLGDYLRDTIRKDLEDRRAEREGIK